MIDDSCVCGKKKDSRSRLCSICSRRGYPVEGVLLTEQLKSEIIEKASKCKSFLELANLTGFGRTTITRWIKQKKIDIDISHFKGARNRFTKIENLLVKSEKRKNGPVKSCILREGLLDYVCECGQQPMWLGKELVLEMDHVNGDATDNRLENLRFLCPNCHSQTPTSKGKNCKNVKKQRS